MTPPLPDLLSAWRALHRRAGPPDRLLPDELQAVQTALQRLSNGFGGRRALAGKDYWEDPGLSGAYLLYFWPVSYLQARAALRLSGGIAPGAAVLELGAGPAPMSRALLDAGAGSATVAERSPRALALARDLIAPRPIRTLRWDGERDPVPDGSYDCLLFGHVLNELWKQEPDRIARRARLVAQAAARLRPGGTVLILEPARHIINAEALALRDALRDLPAAERPPILGPCLYGGPCPARAEGAACHAESRWTPPPIAAQLCARVGIDRERLPFTWLRLGRPGEAAPAPHPGALRVLSERRTNKAGRERVLACGPQGRCSLSAPAAHDPAWGAIWRRLDRGDAVIVEGAEARESGPGLTAQSRLLPLGTPLTPPAPPPPPR